ncbi:MAG: DUF5050 domain-containing protein [Eubacteriales bacterium]|nr:DUF5050 domain-containing protein [Eubacteriales bacterium]
MKKALCLALAALTLLCFVPAAAETSSPSVDTLVQDGNYTDALAAVEKIIQADPHNDEAYLLKVRIRLLALKEANQALNDMIAEDIGSVQDRYAYVETSKALYATAGFMLTIPFTPDYASSAEVNAEGGFPQNLNTGLWLSGKGGDGTAINGLFAAQGPWIYFVDPLDNFYLYKMRAGGGDKQKVLAVVAASLNVCGDWIYYRAVDENNKIYKVRTDGSENTLLCEDDCANLCVKDEWIYYENAGDDHTLYTINIDGSQRRSLGEKGTLHFLSDVYLYYSSQDEKTLSRLNIWGEAETILKKTWHIGLTQIGDRLYYTVDQKGMVIMSMNPDGSDQTEVLRVDGKAYCYAVSQGKFIFSTRSTDNEELLLCYDQLTMQDPVKLPSDSTSALCVDAAGNLYVLNADGLYLIDPIGQTVSKLE